MPWEEWHGLWEHPFTPMAIPTSDGRHYQCTRNGANAAHTLTSQVWVAREDYRAAFERKVFERESFKAIGDAISLCKTHLPGDQSGDSEPAPEFYKAVAQDYEKGLNDLAAKVKRTLNRHIPCHLFHRDQHVPAFEVGPVTFLPRAEWISRYVVDPPVHRLLDRFERGEITRDDLRRAVQDQRDDGETDAIELIDFLGHFGWVGTVTVEGTEAGRGHEKASTLVGLALDAVGLRFTIEDARSFAKAGQQHHYNEARLATNEAGQFTKGWSMFRPGLSGPPGRLAAKMKSEQPFLEMTGSLLHAYLAARGSGRALHAVERWVNALYWFGAARREASDFIAVVDYGCAMDGVSGAGGSIGPMTEFAEAVLRPDAVPATESGLTVKEAVRRVYAEGRNKLAHGEEPGLLEDQQEARRISDMLVSLLLNEFTPVLAELIKAKHRMLSLDEKRFYRALIAHMRIRALPSPLDNDGSEQPS